MRATASSDRSKETRWAITETASAAVVGVGPARELVQVVADARDLAGALSLDGPSPARSTSAFAPSRRRNNSDGDTPAAAAFSRQAACSAGVTRAATITVRRSGTGAPATGFGAPRLPRPIR